VKSSLFCDLYELTMARAYIQSNVLGPAVFELTFRRLPPARRYVVAAGLDDVLLFLEQLHFDAQDLEYLRGLGLFDEQSLDVLANLRFSGDVWAVPEGTVVFPNEPIVQVVAPIAEAQIAETYLLNQIHHQSLMASKAARIVEAAAGRAVVDFGSRRAHGTDAALKAARASYLVGFAGTSNVAAGQQYGLSVMGTMAHSFVQACGDDLTAFQAFSQCFPQATLLVDTYDTLAGVDAVIALAKRLGRAFSVRAIRLDSGDLAGLARMARRRLDAAGLTEVQIFASSDLDERKIAELVGANAPIDGFGVGTRLAVSEDAPALDMVYKLVEYAGEPRAKLSPHKVVAPGRKQVFRRQHDGLWAGDTIAPFAEQGDGEPLLRRVMANGRRLEQCSLETARGRFASSRRHMPPSLGIGSGATQAYPVEVASVLSP
jgi:nicotinate phosphoribosyltransferase